MKNLILILVLLISTIADAQWVKVSNMSFTSAAVTGSNIYAAKDYGEIYKTTVGDTNWVQVSHINPGGSGSISLAVNGNRIFAGGPNGFYYTTDGDTNWTQTFTGGSSNLLSTPSGLYIISGNYIWRSSNNGVSFVQTASPQNPTALGSNVNGSIIYAGYTSGLYLSNNNGSSWTLLAALDTVMITSVKTNGSNIYVTTSGSTSNPGSIWISSNNGTNWARTQISGTIGYNSIVIVNNDVFIGSTSGILLSRDNGNTWRFKNEGINGTWGSFVLVYGNGYIFAPNFGKTYKRLYTEIISVRNISTEVPDKFSLSQNYPNPFNPSTTIRYQIPKQEVITLKIFDVTGKVIETLVNEKQSPGTYEVNWNASKYSSGVYFYRVEAENFTDTKRMLLIK